MRRPRRNHTPAFKAKVALAAIKGEKSLTQLDEQFGIHSNQTTQWKSQLLRKAAESFMTPTERTATHGPCVTDLQEKTDRDVEATAARKEVRDLEEDLRAARKLLDEQSGATLRLQANFGSEEDGLRKMLPRPTPNRRKQRSVASRYPTRKQVT